MIFIVLDDVIKNPDKYVSDILSKEFVDVFDGVNTFKGIQPREDDEFVRFVKNYFNIKMSLKYDVAYNFVRQSPMNQPEPNFIHTDEMMGDITAVLYLNKVYPQGDGTIIYDESHIPKCSIHMKYNRAAIFASRNPHSRGLIDNFGIGDESRLVQVLFLKHT